MEAIKKFMQDHYTDERLADLLAHAQDGKLLYGTCCCFIGAATADHPLVSKFEDFSPNHYYAATNLEGARASESEFYQLGDGAPYPGHDGQRRAKLIPLIMEEMDRRAKLRGTRVETPELVAV